MASYTIWQQGNNKLLYDPAGGHFDFQTAGYLKLNGSVVGLSGGAFNGTPIQADFTVTGNQGGGVYIPRTVTLGDRRLAPTDVTLRPITGPLTQPDPYVLAVGDIVEQRLEAGAFQTLFGGTNVAQALQKVRLYVAGTNTGITDDILAPVLVRLVDARTNTSLAEAQITGLLSEGNEALTLQLVELDWAEVTVPADQAAHLAIQIAGGGRLEGGVAHRLVLGMYPYPEPLQTTQAAYARTADLPTLGVNLAWEVMAVRYQPEAVGSLRFFGKLTEDLSVADGVRLDGVDLSAFRQDYLQLKLTTIPQLLQGLGTKESLIPVAATPPSGPVAGVSKWLDVGTPSRPVLRFYDGSAWQPVGLSGPTVDVTFRDTIVRDLSVNGRLLSSLALAPGVKIGGIDLAAMAQTVASLTESQVTESLIVNETLTVGAYGPPYEHPIDQQAGFVSGSPWPQHTPLAQSFQLPNPSSLYKVTVQAKSEAAVGKLTVTVHQGVPTDAGRDSGLASAEVSLTGSDASARAYEIAFVSPPVLQARETYYLELVTSEGAQLDFVTSAGTDAYPDGQLYEAAGLTDSYLPLDPVNEGDLAFTLEVGTIPTGGQRIIGDLDVTGDVTAGTIGSLAGFLGRLTEELGFNPDGSKPDFASTAYIAAGGTVHDALEALDQALETLPQDLALDGDVTGTPEATVVTAIQGIEVAETAPVLDQILMCVGGKWAPATIPSLLAETQIRLDFKWTGPLSQLATLELPLMAVDGMRMVGNEDILIKEVLISLQDSGSTGVTAINLHQGTSGNAPTPLYTGALKPAIESGRGEWVVETAPAPDEDTLSAGSYLVLGLESVAVGAYDLTVTVIGRVVKE